MFFFMFFFLFFFKSLSYFSFFKGIRIINDLSPQ